MASKLDLLGEVPMFSACTKRELRDIARVADRVSVLRGELLAKEGQAGREFFVIAEGKATVSINGEEVAVLGPGDFFGETALLDQGPRSATVVADTPMTVYVIGARDFLDLVEEVPLFARRIMRGLSQRLRAAENAPSYAWNSY